MGAPNPEGIYAFLNMERERQSRPLLQTLRSSAAEQAQRAPTYAHGVQRPQPSTKNLAKPKVERPILKERCEMLPDQLEPPAIRSIDLANESPRIDALTLTNRLDRDLASKQARADGICPVRRDLFSNCFEDLLRRVSHDCMERGLLLQRVRDEARLTLDTYRTVFEGSVDYVTNTAWQDDAEIAAQREHIKRVEEDVSALQNQVETLHARRHAVAAEGAAVLETIREQHAKQVKSINDNIAQLKKFSEDMERSQEPHE